MNSDPLELFNELETLYAEFGAVKLTASDAWNSPFNFGFVDRPATVRKQVMQELQEGKVTPNLLLPSWKVLSFFLLSYLGLRTTCPGHPHLGIQGKCACLF